MSKVNRYKIGRPVWRDDGVEWTLGKYQPGDEASFLELQPVCRTWEDLEPWEQQSIRAHIGIIADKPISMNDAELVYDYIYRYMEGKKQLKK